MKAVPWALIGIVLLAAFFVWNYTSLHADCDARNGTIHRVGNGHLCLAADGRVLRTYAR